MARKRDLDPGLWENEDLAGVARDARLLFIAYISQADDDGRLKGSARYLRSKAFPYDEDVSADAVQGWRDDLVASGPLLPIRRRRRGVSPSAELAQMAVDQPTRVFTPAWLSSA